MVAAQIEQFAADLRIGISPTAWPSTAPLRRSKSFTTIRQMQASGGMKQVSSAFKVACVVTPSARYRDHLGAFKLSWSKQMAAAMGLIHGFQI